jgi:hypothetical protein
MAVADGRPASWDRDALPIEVSFVLPCLNEAETLATCLQAIHRCIAEHRLAAEIVVADNGSTDGSQAIARRCGARVVDVRAKGYGNALMGGFAAARGKYLIMGDADGSYDFAAAMPFIERLRAGCDLVMGSRFKGRILPGAMPWKHKWIGNPVLSWTGRVLYHTTVSDFHCGLRAFTKEAYEHLRCRTTGMEFASEVVIKAALQGLRIAEVPITLHPDGRSRPPHLRSWRDGRRHLAFMLVLCPRWTLVLPGLLMLLTGVILGTCVVLGPRSVFAITFDVHTLVAASLLTLLGSHSLLVGLAARFYALRFEVGPPRPALRRFFEWFTLERGLILGGTLFLLGLALVGRLTWHWIAGGCGPLHVQHTLRPMVVGTTLMLLGAQTGLMAFFYSMLRIQHTTASEERP